MNYTIVSFENQVLYFYHFLFIFVSLLCVIYSVLCLFSLDYFIIIISNEKYESGYEKLKKKKNWKANIISTWSTGYFISSKKN